MIPPFFLIYKLHVIGLTFLHDFAEFTDSAALACIVFHHLREFLFVIACDAVGQNMNGISGFGHVVTGGFYASCGICTGDKKLGDVAFLDKGCKFFACLVLSIIVDTISQKIYKPASIYYSTYSLR